MITVEDITIIGGEPLLHPQINLWAVELRQAFPNCEDFKICTNGTVLHRQDPLQVQHWHDLGIVLEIHCHSDSHWQTVWTVLHSIFARYTVELHGCTELATVYDDKILMYANGRLAAMVHLSKKFQPNNIRSSGDQLEFYQTDPHTAHRSCPIGQCHYMVDGLLYKCAPVAVGRDLAAQFCMEQRAVDLFRSYDPIDPQDPDIETKLTQLTQAIDQCSLCPVYSSLDQPHSLVQLNLSKSKPIIPTV